MPVPSWRTVFGVGWIRIVALAGVLVIGACSGDGDDGVTGPTVPPGGETSTTGAPSTTTTAPANYDVPELIDQAYVQRVVSAYDEVLGDAIRVLKRDGGLSDEFLKHLLAIYSADEFEFQQQLWGESVAKGRLEKTPAEPGDPATAVGAVVSATPTCVIARAERDLSANFTGTQAESSQDDYLVLVRKAAGRDPLNRNPTPWVLGFDGYKADNSVPTDECP